MSKGTVVLVPFPFTDLSGQKVRPCVVLYQQKGGDDCVLAFMSSVGSKTKKSFDINIKASKKNGLKIDSTLKIDKIATLQKKIILGELGKLEDSIVKMLDKKLKRLFDLR